MSELIQFDGRTVAVIAPEDLEQLEEDLARLRDVIDRAAKAWLTLEPPVVWEGDVGDAMKAGVKEIERLREELDVAALEVQRLERLVWSPMAAYPEIERLRMELTKVGNSSYNPALVIAEQQAEIERLQAEINDLRAVQLADRGADAIYDE